MAEAQIVGEASGFRGGYEITPAIAGTLRVASSSIGVVELDRAVCTPNGADANCGFLNATDANFSEALLTVAAGETVYAFIDHLFDLESDEVETITIEMLP